MIRSGTFGALRRALRQYDESRLGRRVRTPEEMARIENRLIQACRNLVQEDDDS